MEKIVYTDIEDQQLVDIRTQHDYQAGYVENSLNLNPGNFKKYATYYLTTEQPIIFIVGSVDQAELEEISTIAEELGFTQAKGYLSIDEVPSDQLKKIATIPAAAFLNKEDEFILLDVRQPAEITRPAPEKNLVNIPFEELIDDFERLDSGKEIYTLCGSGNRSTAASSFLEQKGFNTVVIEGGMKAVEEITKK